MAKIIGYKIIDGKAIGYDESMDGLVDDLLSPDHSDIAVLLLKASKDQGLQAVLAYANNMRSQIAGTANSQEMVGWAVKLSAAQAVLGGSPTVDQMSALAFEATARKKGESPAQLATKVVGNAAIFSKASGAIDGVERSAKDAVKAATTPQEVAAALVTAKAEALAMFAQLFP